MNEVEEFVGQTEAIVEVGVLVEAETQLGQLRVGHHLLVRHPREETHSVGDLRLFDHFLQSWQHIATTDNHQEAVVQERHGLHQFLRPALDVDARALQHQQVFVSRQP